MSNEEAVNEALERLQRAIQDIISASSTDDQILTGFVVNANVYNGDHNKVVQIIPVSQSAALDYGLSAIGYHQQVNIHTGGN